MADISCGNVTQCPFKANVPLDRCTDGKKLEHLRIRNFSAMLNLVSSTGLSKCGTLFPSLSLMNSPLSETSYQAGCKLFLKKYMGPSYSGTFDTYAVSFFAFLVNPEFEVPNIFYT